MSTHPAEAPVIAAAQARILRASSSAQAAANEAVAIAADRAEHATTAYWDTPTWQNEAAAEIARIDLRDAVIARRCAL